MSKAPTGSAETALEERFLIADNDKYNLPSSSPQDLVFISHSGQQSVGEQRPSDVQQTKEQQLQQEVQNLQKLLDVYQQNHGHSVCIQLTNLNAVGGQISKILSVC